MTRIKILHIKGKNIDIEKRDITKEGDAVKFKEGDKIPFNSDMIFNLATKSFKNKVAIKRKPALLYNSGKKTFLKIGENDETVEGITNEDRRQFTYRSLARALTKVKPISMTQFIIIIALQMVLIGLVILSIRGGIP